MTAYSCNLSISTIPRARLHSGQEEEEEGSVRDAQTPTAGVASSRGQRYGNGDGGGDTGNFHGCRVEPLVPRRRRRRRVRTTSEIILADSAKLGPGWDVGELISVGSMSTISELKPMERWKTNVLEVTNGRGVVVKRAFPQVTRMK